MMIRELLCVLCFAVAQVSTAKVPVDKVSVDKAPVDSEASGLAVEKLQASLKSISLEPDWLDKLARREEASTPLTSQDAHRASDLLWEAYTQRLREERADEMEARKIEIDNATMKFFLKRFGEPDKRGRSLFISMHGGGGARAQVNDQQWENQKRLYEPQEGIYVAPRAPSNEWDLWHREPVGRMFDRLIENLIVLENVDPNRVYLMGYSAGGDGTYQLAPRMADRWAAAAMMAGHPNDASPLGLRNIGFILQVGGLDAAYGRNKIAVEWEKQLAELRKQDPQGYAHRVKIYPDKGHWMDREDAMALPWMAKFVRNPLPPRVVWRQDDITRERFYWLGVTKNQAIPHSTVMAVFDKKRRYVEITSEKVTQLSVFLNDTMGDLDKPWIVTINGQQLSPLVPERTIAVLAESLSKRGDRELMFSAEIPCQADSAN